MKKAGLIVLMGVVLFSLHVHALERPDVEFKIFQFPHDKIPRIDGNPDDWGIVPESYIIGSDQLSDTVKGHGTNLDPKDLKVSVRVGWVKGMNHLYFLYETYDDYWNFVGRLNTPAGWDFGDVFEVVVDADLSGGQFITNDQLDQKETYYRFQGVHAQNYHIFTPPPEGYVWAMVWGNQPWIRELPWANYAYSYDFKEGESGRLILEFWITPFDYAPYDGPGNAVVSQLYENKVIGLSWSVLDFDEDSSQYEGFWNLSHKTRMDSNATCQVAFRLMPLELRFAKPIEARWSFKVIDREKRIVAFTDESAGAVTSWLWDFNDGTNSAEQNPVHTFEKPGFYDVMLTVTGPSGASRCMKIYDVGVP